jgi:tetratricopeptide (TPR) repeat protein
MALAYLDKADRLVADVRPRSLLTRGLNQLHAGRIEEAVETLERVQDAVPRWMHYKLNALTSLDLAAGDYDKALSRYESQRDSCLEPKRAGWDQNCAAGAFARTLQATGDSANAIRLCRSFEHDAGLLPTEFGDVRDLFLIGSSGRAFLYAGDLAICGRQDEALELIEKAVNLGFRGHAMAFGDWRFAAFHDIRLDAIRDHSRFRAAMAIIEADMAQQLKNVRAMQRRGEIPTLEELNAEVAAE